MAPVANATRQDIARTKTRDRDFANHQNTLLARMAAVVGAQRAVAAGETGARYALRQSLVDLAASAELIAAELPAPTHCRVNGRGGWNVG
jgi:hypothetical protein